MAQTGRTDENSTRKYSPPEELCHPYDVENRRIYMMSRDVDGPLARPAPAGKRHPEADRLINNASGSFGA
jgi:hypothetical protein